MQQKASSENYRYGPSNVLGFPEARNSTRAQRTIAEPAKEHGECMKAFVLGVIRHLMLRMRAKNIVEENVGWKRGWGFARHVMESDSIMECAY